MKKMLVALAIIAALSPIPAAKAGVNVGISIGFPVLPPEIVIQPGPPAYWFWDDGRGMWFYYDSGRRRHYDRRHGYMDDGRHYYVREGGWHPAREDNGRHRGWYKHDKHGKHERDRDRDRDRNHDRDRDRGDDREHGHGHDRD